MSMSSVAEQVLQKLKQGVPFWRRGRSDKVAKAKTVNTTASAAPVPSSPVASANRNIVGSCEAATRTGEVSLEVRRYSSNSDFDNQDEFMRQFVGNNTAVYRASCSPALPLRSRRSSSASPSSRSSSFQSTSSRQSTSSLGPIEVGVDLSVSALQALYPHQWDQSVDLDSRQHFFLKKLKNLVENEEETFVEYIRQKRLLHHTFLKSV
eukprot:GFYU01006024.1.p1 GENE.GFYU01006024.1~~GFYU01006024.1.p1  ORF type:complete len:208 (-),score=25.21 GFYU01006024.1:118-741(-)